ncbi:MAG: hypothetical protein LBO71_00340 [Prevotellaceae bacterium]|jgi:hypothetical protein|nr:hypothetical protein [Prevotellaceae bacterium]
MKRILLTIAGALMMLAAAQAGDRAPWREYTGCYAFPGEYMIDPIEIALHGDTLLTIFTPMMGEVALTHAGKDRFKFPQYGGVIVFERDEKQRVAACRIAVTAMSVGELRAKKTVKNNEKQ